jgi:hypothetical protein
MIITLYKTGHDGRIHYYTIHDRQPVLDAPFALCSSWRIGTGRERERLHRFETSTERDKAVRSLVARRIKDGYRILYFFSRSKFAIDLAASSQSSATEPTRGMDAAN